jgi:hypothetical protein
MKRLALTLLFCILLGAMVYSQNIKKVSATYTYYAPETMSVEEAKRTALERAKIQAIADEFGTIVSQSSSTIITNKNGKSDTQFFSLGGSDVKGEWIETIGEPNYYLTFDEHLLVVTCSIRGKAREITTPKIDFIAKPLRNGTTLKYESTDFRNGDDFYLYFQSPEDGFLTVFLVDESTQIVYEVLPYKSDARAAYPIQRGSEYILFSTVNAEKSERSVVDEYTLTCENEKEFNTLYIIFSSTPVRHILQLKDSQTYNPKNVHLKDFSKWLSKTMSTDPTLQVAKIILSIEK